MLKNIIQLPHAVRVSPRAKYIRFRILAGIGLEIERAAGLRPDLQQLPEQIILAANTRSL
jgi:hypothetical protein